MYTLEKKNICGFVYLHVAHSKLKDKLAATTDFDPDEGGLRTRSDELSQNALTGLFLVLRLICLLGYFANAYESNTDRIVMK